jgi:hypothetical protein
MCRCNPICVLLQAPSACVDATTWVRGLYDFLETFISLQSAMAFLSFESIEWVKKTVSKIQYIYNRT